MPLPGGVRQDGIVAPVVLGTRRHIVATVPDVTPSLARMRILFRAFHLDRREGRSALATAVGNYTMARLRPDGVNWKRVEQRLAEVRDSAT